MIPVVKGKFFTSLANSLRYIVFTNIFISVCSLVMSLYTFQFFDIRVNGYLLLFIACGTLSSYSFHWALPSTHSQLSPRETWSKNNRFILMILFFIGMAGSVYSFIFLKLYTQIIIPLLILTFLYSSGKLPFGPFRFFRKYFFGKTLYLALVWCLVTVYLPLAAAGIAWNEKFTFFTINRFFFLFAICILFDLRDKASDTLQGIKSLITLLDISRIKMLFAASLTISFIAGGFLFSAQTGIIKIVILLFPILLTFASYGLSTRTRSELWFYFYLDGLMMLSGIFSLVYSIFT